MFCKLYVAHLENTEKKRLEDLHCVILKKKLMEIGIDDEICVPGQYSHLICPMVCYSL